MTRAFLAAALAVFVAPAAFAGNVDLVGLPPRDGVSLTIYNSEDLTLARETRSITFRKGLNRLQFSWANTLIDPSSIEFRPREHADKIQVVDATFPADRPEVVVWNVESEVEGQVECEVEYFTSGLSWAMDYVGVCVPSEVSMRFDGFVTVTNHSGEDYEGASVRLVVGVVNLVEKIADLARRRGIPVPEERGREWEGLRKEAMVDALDFNAEPAAGGSAAGEEQQIIKEGLSEYFLFTVKGEEDVPNGWSKRMRAVKTEKPVSFEIVYRLRDYQYGPAPVRFLLWKNDKDHGLGDSPLPDGVIRLFRDNGRDGLAFLGQEAVRYIPISEDVEVNVGTDDEVVHELDKVSARRHDFAFSQADRRRDERVVGWNETEVWRERIRNYRDRAVRFEIRRQFQGDVEVSGEVGVVAHDAHTIETMFEVPARETQEFRYMTLIKQGENARQDRVVVK